MRSTLRKLCGERSLVRRRAVSLAFLTTAMVLCAVVLHLVAEGVGIGPQALLASLTTRHAYLLAFTAGAAALGLALLAGEGGSPSRCLRRVRRILADLPLRRNRIAFVGLAAVSQVGLFGAAQALEGNPIASGDCFAAWSTALFLSFAAALLLDTLPQGVIRLIVAVYRLRRTDWHGTVRASVLRRPVRWITRFVNESYRAVVGSRPPPGIRHVFSR